MVGISRRYMWSVFLGGISGRYMFGVFLPHPVPEIEIGKDKSATNFARRTKLKSKHQTRGKGKMDTI